MGVDNVLGWEVITADGNTLVANSLVNPDLFWALKGGGPLTYGVVTSVTLKTFSEFPSAAVTLDVSTTNLTLFWKAVEVVHAYSNTYVNNGMFAYFELFPGSFRVQPFAAPNKTKAEVDSILKPVFADLDAAKVPYNTTSTEYPTWFELYDKLFEDERPGDVVIVGGRVFTQEDVAKNNTAIVATYRAVSEGTGGTLPGAVFGHLVGPGVGRPVVNNPLTPVWRNASSFTVISIPSNPSFQNKTDVQRILTHTYQKAMIEAGPKGAAYINEVCTVHRHAGV
jgi:hypothetical protein